MFWKKYFSSFQVVLFDKFMKKHFHTYNLTQTNAQNFSNCVSVN